MSPTAPAEPSRRRVATRAAAGTLGGFVARRVIEILVLWMVGVYASRDAIGLFREWQAVIVPLAIIVSGGWDTAFLRRRHSKPGAFRVLAMWTIFASILLSIALFAAAPLIARWYDDGMAAWWLRLAGVGLIAEAARRTVRPVLADELRFGVITLWELLRSLVYGVGAVGVLLLVMDEPANAATIAFVAGGFIVASLVADAVEACGLLFVQRRQGEYPLDRRPGRHVELWREGAGRPPVKRADASATTHDATTATAPLRAKAIWRRDRGFASAVMSDSLLNALGVYLPIYLLGRYSGNESVAYYSYALAMVAIPMNLLLDAVHRVLLPSLSDLPRDRQAAGVLQVAEVMAIVTLPLLVWIGVFAPNLFVELLGAGWEPAGAMTRGLLLFLVFAPTTHLCTTVLALTGRADVGLVWNFATLGGRLAVLWIGLRWGGPLEAIVLYGLHGAGMYLLYQRHLSRVMGLSPWAYLGSWLRFAWLWVLLGGGWMLLSIQHPETGLAGMMVVGLAGGAFYAAGLAVVHRRAFMELIGLIQHLRRDRGVAPLTSDQDITTA